MMAFAFPVWSCHVTGKSCLIGDILEAEYHENTNT